ncbi:transglutaminase family protein [Duganella phyllosphaerae]|uniref:Protein-glutamine gamma-glutamyltransferase n=1 Tax=Duganella phyllosphaerae TaxID=762836 RepID=A0A1E7X6B7_9BURK|nr:transglutaminase family protein [Duganella phyllosphaerae]OFA08616.1 protein-glutamine gamma-glutamyltransferase [Duganella phyllosphaerae]
MKVPMIEWPIGAVACARYRVVHETRYQYQSTVTLSQQYLHMTPRPFAWQHTESHLVWLDPVVSEGRDGVDYFGNNVRHVALTVPHDSLLVHAESTVLLRARPTLARITATLPWESVRDMMGKEKSAATLEACRYLYASPHVHWFPELEAYARLSFTPGRPQLDAALDLTRRIFEDFEFDSKATEISTPLEQVLSGRRGVCQDFAQLMIGCLRSIGLPARYISGYILTHPPEGKPRLVGADASHAWVSVYCPSLGWVDFDPTNRCLVQHEHITLGWGRDFSDVTPMRGIVLGGGRQELDVQVTVTPLPVLGGA